MSTQDAGAALPAAGTPPHRPLYVDLDGTLIKSDLLWESLCALASKQPLLMLRLPSWISAGKASFKQHIADHASIDPRTLPYNVSVLEFVATQYKAGRRVVLATASDHRLAKAVADHLGCFTHVLATQAGVNLKGVVKLEAIRADCGERAFDYIGDSPADAPIWAAATTAHIVGSGRRIHAIASRLAPPNWLRTDPPGGLGQALRLIRPHQWCKNLLLFAPMVLAHRWEWPTFMVSLLAFACLSLGASATYVLNDLLDLHSDRNHPRKRNRPIASGSIRPQTAAFVMFAALAAAVAISCSLWPVLPGVLLGYMAATTAYTLWLKRKVFIDVLSLAGLYTYRVLAGGLVTGIPVSNWLLAFCIFLFLSLALAKRYSELLLTSSDGDRNKRRAYHAVDLLLLGQLGSTCGCIAVLVLLLYCNDPVPMSHYRHPQLLWLMSPLLLYWIARVWFLAYRGELHEDPVVFAIKDRNSHVLLAIAVVVLLATMVN